MTEIVIVTVERKDGKSLCVGAFSDRSTATAIFQKYFSKGYQCSLTATELDSHKDFIEMDIEEE